MRHSVATFALTLVFALPSADVRAADPPPRAGTGRISGTVIHSETREPIANALVVLQCTCLAGSRETTTDPRGRYAFARLPPGTYTVQVLAGQADVSKVFELPAR